MCDYSLQGLPNRLAVEGEQLVTYRFPTGSVGLATAADIAAAKRPKPRGECRHTWWAALKNWLDPQMELDRVPAVCIPPGGRLLMSQIPEPLKRKFALQSVECVTFVQLSADAYRHRDGIQFRNGKQMLLQDLSQPVYFDVVSLNSSTQEAAAEPRQVADVPTETPVADMLLTR
jgi:hypothetical protein